MSEGPKIIADLDAERAVLGAVLLDGDCLGLIEGLAASDFSHSFHGRIFAAMAGLREENAPVDALTVTRALLDRGDTEAGQFPAYSIELTGNLLRGVNVGHYARAVKNASMLRGLLKLGHDMQLFAGQPGAKPADILSFAEARIAAASEGARDERGRISSIANVPGFGGVPDIPADWLVEGFIPRRALVFISGEPGALKSWLSADLAGRIAAGRAFCGRGVKRTPVLVLDRENPASVIRYRRDFLATGDPSGLHYWGLWASEPPAGPCDRRVREFAGNGGVVMFDSTVRFHSSDENSASEMARVTGWFRNLVSIGGTCVCFVHKSDKSEKVYRGSSEFLAGADILWAAAKRDDRVTMDLKAIKNRFEAEGSFSVQLTRGGFVAAEGVGQSQSRASREIMAEIVGQAPGITASELEKRAVAAGLGRSQARLVMDDGLFRVEHGPRNARRYFLAGGVQ